MQHHKAALESLRQGVEMDKHNLDDGEAKLAALDAAIALLSTPPASDEPQDYQAADERLRMEGVFKGAEGLRLLAESDVFWSDKPYGTRLYFGDDMAHYLHRSVLRAAVRALAAPSAAPSPASEQDAKDAVRYRKIRDLAIYDGAYGGQVTIEPLPWPSESLPNTADYLDAALDAMPAMHGDGNGAD